MSKRLKELVLKTEILIGILGVRTPLHSQSHRFSLALSIDWNESDRLVFVCLNFLDHSSGHII